MYFYIQIDNGMKYFFSISFCFLMIIAGCKPKSKGSSTISDKKDKEQVSIDPEKMQDAAADMEKIKEELSNLTPVTSEQLKALVPAQLMGAPYSDLEVSTSTGASIASAVYKINDSTTVKLSIIDCAGPGGSGIYSLQYLGMLNVQEENEDEYTRTMEFNGAKAFEHCDKTDKSCSFTYFARNRFLIALEGEGITATALKQAAKGLDIK